MADLHLPQDETDDVYFLPDFKGWEVANERFRRADALWRVGEMTAFVLMWTMIDFQADLVERCHTCYEAYEPFADVYHQSAKARCPECYGTTFTGGYKAILIRPALWNWNEETLERDKRGVIDPASGSVQTTGDFRLQPKDYLLRADGSRWEVRGVDRERLITGFGLPDGSSNAVGFAYQVAREDESSAAYVIPISTATLQSRLSQFYQRSPQSFADLEVIRDGATLFPLPTTA